jgi:hypothetical protein
MKTAAIKTAGKAVSERVAGMQPGRWSAFVAAAATGTATAVLTYKALRSADDS